MVNVASVTDTGGPARPDRLQTWEWVLLALVTAAFVALRLYHGGAPLVDDSDWRQTDTASEAWFFIHRGLGLLPQLFYNGPGPNYVQLEFPFLPITVALLAHVFQFGSWLLHSVAAAYDTLAMVCLWFFARETVGRRAAWWVAGVFAVQPLGIFFGRAFQPEPAMLAGMTATLWLTARWARRGGAVNYVLALAAFSFAILAKLPAAIIAPAVFFLALRGRRWSDPAVWGLVIVPVVPAALYTIWAGTVVTPGYNFITIILQLLRQSSYHVGVPSAPEFWYHFLLETCISGAGAVPLAVGFLSPSIRKEIWFWTWGAALLLWCVVVMRHIRFEYYLVPLLPWFALAEGAGLSLLITWAAENRAVQAFIAAAVLIGTPLFSLRVLHELYTLDEFSYQAGIALRKDLGPGPVILGTENPPILFYSRHHGWRTSELTMAELQRWMAKGARYYIPLTSLGNPTVAAYVRQHFRREVAGPIVYYELDKPPVAAS